MFRLLLPFAAISLAAVAVVGLVIAPMIAIPLLLGGATGLAVLPGLTFFRRDSGGGLILLAWHPRWSQTWIWCLTWQPARADERRSWFDAFAIGRPGPAGRQYYLMLLRRGALVFATQSYHRQMARGIA